MHILLDLYRFHLGRVTRINGIVGSSVCLFGVAYFFESGSCYINKNGLESLKDLPAYASQVLGLKACANTQPGLVFLTLNFSCSWLKLIVLFTNFISCNFSIIVY